MAYFRVVVAMAMAVLMSLSCSLANESFNVASYGADPNGNKESTQAFQNAWNAACNANGQPSFYVPKGSYLLYRVSFNGPCKSGQLLFQIDGTILSPGYPSALDQATEAWIRFFSVSGIQIRGGVLDARGSSLWNCKRSNPNKCPTGITSLSFVNSHHVNVNGLTSKDSQSFHISTYNSNHITFQSLIITAASNSLNTDGIHIANSNNINILGSNIASGDDCISLGPGSNSIWIDNVHCRSGHGISIGSLGSGDGEAGVENITVIGSTMTSTTNGLRIKTYPTNHKGYVKDVTYKHNIMNNVQNPIIIDQHYCNGKAQYCSGQESGVKISNVKYIDIQGTSANGVGVNFNCSKANACSELYMETINILKGTATCNNAYGHASGSLTPPSCLA